MTEQPTVELTTAQRASGSRLRKCVEDIRAAAAQNTVVKLTPDAAIALADLIELLARHAGIDLSQPVQP